MCVSIKYKEKPPSDYQGWISTWEQWATAVVLRTLRGPAASRFTLWQLVCCNLICCKCVCWFCVCTTDAHYKGKWYGAIMQQLHCYLTLRPHFFFEGPKVKFSLIFFCLLFIYQFVLKEQLNSRTTVRQYIMTSLLGVATGATEHKIAHFCKIWLSNRNI